MLLMIFIALSCKKDNDNDDDDNGGSIVCTLMKTVKTEVGENADTSIYEYNTSGQLVKIAYWEEGMTQAFGYDTVIYQSGNISQIKRYYTGETDPDRTYSYTFTGSNITQIVEQGTENDTAYTATYTYTYTDGNLTSMTSTGSPHENMSFDNATYENGNLSYIEMDFGGTGDAIMKMTAVFDNKKNVLRHYIPVPDQMVLACNTNNMMQAVLADSVHFNDTTYLEGSLIMDKTFTYTTEDEVETITENPTIFDDQDANQRITTHTYECIEQ